MESQPIAAHCYGHCAPAEFRLLQQLLMGFLAPKVCQALIATVVFLLLTSCTDPGRNLNLWSFTAPQQLPIINSPGTEGTR